MCIRDRADDLRCWLQGKPVAARVPSRGYRFRRFVRRNRLAVGATAAVFLALAGGLGAALWQTHQARLQAPVSYTHLDVYKRQPLAVPGLIWRSRRKTASMAHKRSLAFTSRWT